MTRRHCFLVTVQFSFPYAEAGQFDKAVQTAQKACDLATANGEKELLARNQELLALYRQGKAYHETK